MGRVHCLSSEVLSPRQGWGYGPLSPAEGLESDSPGPCAATMHEYIPQSLQTLPNHLPASWDGWGGGPGEKVNYLRQPGWLQEAQLS